MRYSDNIVKCWKQLSLELSLPPEVVDKIDVDHIHITDKCYDMFNTWLERTCDPCWCLVASAFKMVKLNEAAGKIENKFSKLLLNYMLGNCYCMYIYLNQNNPGVKKVAAKN